MHLLGHSDIYFFGFGTNGRKVRPFKLEGGAWTDTGLSPNTQEFIRALKRMFELQR